MNLSCANPSCLTPLDELRGVNPNEKPVPGSIAICGECGYISVIESYKVVYIPNRKGFKLSTRLITDDEYKHLSDHDKVDLSFAIRVIRAQHALKNTKLILPDYYPNDT